MPMFMFMLVRVLTTHGLTSGVDGGYVRVCVRLRVYVVVPLVEMLPVLTGELQF